MAAAASFDGEEFVVPRHGGGSSSGTTLGVHAASRKIGKQQERERKPVIIYMVSPKVIHVEAHEFMPLVQRLTGPDSSAAGGPSTSSGAGGAASSSSTPTTTGRPWRVQEAGGARNQLDRATPPVRVKARALNRPAGAAVSVSVTATRTMSSSSNHAPSSSAAAPSPSSSGFMFQDLSPLRGAALKGEHPLMMVSPGWLHHVGDHFLSPGAVGAAGLGSPSSAGFLDIFGPVSSSQQQQQQ